MSLLHSLTVAVLLSAGALTGLAGEEKPLRLSSADGTEYDPLAAGDRKGVVLFFVSAYCPTSNTFVKEMNKIAAEHEAHFKFYLVHSDRDLKVADVVQHTQINEIKVPVLLDPEQKLAKREHAKTTPEAVVIGADGKTLYQGRINDLYLTPTKRQRQATRRDLHEALAAVEAGQPVANAKLEAVGCKITGME